MATNQEKVESYEINGEKFRLPPANLGRPMKVQEISGMLEPWPAHASGRLIPTSQIALSKNRDLIVLSEQQSKLPNLVPKPRFLEYLERHVSKEMQRLKVNDVSPSSIRLQIYREVFEWLIEAFKTYKPLLAEIKREYEMMLTYYREEIRKMEPMKEMLWTLSQECDQRVMKLRDGEKLEVKELKNQIRMLNERIAHMNVEHSDLNCQVENLQTKLSEEHHLYRNEADARKLLITDLNELRSQQEDMSISKVGAEVESNEDAVMLKIAYGEAKKKATELGMSLERMKADYGDVIPRKEFEALDKKHTKLIAAHQEMATQKEDIDNSNKSLMEQFSAVHAQRDEYYLKLQELQRSSTPRPDWQRCANVIYGGEDRWKELNSEKKTSDELVDLLLSEITGVSNEDENMIQPLGKEDSVPKFLRYDQPVTNRRMTMRDCKIHIRELIDQRHKQKTDERQAEEESKPFVLQPFNDFVDDFFQNLYGIPQLRIEWAYSFYDSMGRFQHDEHIKTIYSIINQETDEECFWQIMRYITSLRLKIVDVDKEKTGRISRDNLRGVLTSFFETREDAEIQQLIEIVEKELNTPEGESIDYDKLFMANMEGDHGPFLSLLKKWNAADKEKYIDEIRKELEDLGTAKVTSGDVRRVFSIVDPSIIESDLDKYLIWAFNGPIDQLEMCPAVEVSTLIDRLKHGNIIRIGPRT